MHTLQPKIDDEGNRTMEPIGDPSLDIEEYEDELEGYEAEVKDPYEDVDEAEPDDPEEQL